MKRMYHYTSIVIVLALAFGCGLKGKDRHRGPAPETVAPPEESGEDTLDIDAGPGEAEAAQDEPLPMETDFLEWAIVVDEAPHAARIEDALTRTLTFKLTNALERLLTGQIIIDAPIGTVVVPGKTLGWRVRGGRSAAIPAQLSIIEGAPLGRVTLPVQVLVLGQPYRNTQLELVKWLDMRMAGPLPLDEEAGLETPYPPEQKVNFKRGFKYDGQAFAWESLPFEALQPDGMVDFAAVYPAPAKGCAYAALNLYADAATGVVLAFNCDSPSAVFLGRQRVLTAPEALEEDVLVEVTLSKGANTLLVKCCAGEKGWAFVLNIAGKHSPLPPGVRFDVVLRQAPAGN